MQPFDRQWMNGNFIVIVVVIDVVEAVCFPVGSPVGGNTFCGPRGSEVIGEVVLHTVIVQAIGVNNTCVGDVKGVCSSQVVSAASVNDKVSVGWAVQGRCLSGNLLKREVLQNHWTLNGWWVFNDLNQ